MDLAGKFTGLQVPPFASPISMLTEQMFLYHIDLHTIHLHQPASVQERYLYPKETALWRVEMPTETEKNKEKR